MSLFSVDSKCGGTKKPCVNYNEVLRYVDFSQYDGSDSEEKHSVTEKKTIPKSSVNTADSPNFNNARSVSCGNSLENISASSPSCSDSKTSYTALPLQPLEIIKDLHQEDDTKLVDVLRHRTNKSSQITLPGTGSGYLESSSGWNRTQNNNSLAYDEGACGRELDYSSFNHFRPTQTDYNVFMNLHLPMRRIALFDTVPAPLQFSDRLSKNRSISGLHNDHAIVQGHIPTLPRTSSFSGVSSRDSYDSIYLDMDRNLKSTPASKESIISGLFYAKCNESGRPSFSTYKNMDSDLEPDSYIEMNLRKDFKSSKNNLQNVVDIEKPFDDLMDLNGQRLPPLTDEERELCGLQPVIHKRLTRSGSVCNNSSISRKLLKTKLRLFRRNSAKDIPSQKPLDSDDQKCLAIKQSSRMTDYDQPDSHSLSYGCVSSRRGSMDLLAVPEHQEEDEWFSESNLTDEQKQRSCSSLSSRPSVNSSSSIETPPPCIPPRLHPRPAFLNSDSTSTRFNFPSAAGHKYTDSIPPHTSIHNSRRHPVGELAPWEVDHHHSDYCDMTQCNMSTDDLPLTDDYKTRQQVCRRDPPPPPLPPVQLPVPLEETTVSSDVDDDGREDEETIVPPEIPARVPSRKTKPRPLIFSEEHKNLLEMRPPPANSGKWLVHHLDIICYYIIIGL